MSEDRRARRREDDYWTADQFARLDERLKHRERTIDDLSKEVFGNDGRPGLGEQVRTIVKTYGAVIAIATTLVSWFPWIYDHFISKTANVPVFGEAVREKWIKESTKRIRIFDKVSQEWVYYYAIEESHKPKDD